MKGSLDVPFGEVEPVRVAEVEPVRVAEPGEYLEPEFGAFITFPEP